MAVSKNMWMVRAGEDAFLFDTFKQKGITGVGFKKVGDLTDACIREEVREKVNQGYRDPKKRAAALAALDAFRRIIKAGDWVIMSSRNGQEYLVGTVTSVYRYNPDQEDCMHNRQTQWHPESLARDNLPEGVKRSLAPRQTVFRVNPDSRNKILRQLA